MNTDLIFIEINLKYKNLIKKIISKYFENEKDREDVFQDVSMHIYEKLLICPKEKIEIWYLEPRIRMVVRNKCIDIYRRNKNTVFENRKTILSNSHFETEISNSSFNNENNTISQSVKSVNVTELLENLSDKDKELLNLRFIQNKSIKEIDDEMKVKNSAVYITRAIEKLRKIAGYAKFLETYDNFKIID